jgi:hypothetical protein
MKIQGCCGSKDLTKLCLVPPYLKVFSSWEPSEKVELSCSTGLLKCATAVVQLGFACFTLYRTRSNQIEQYEYAAFGLTVIPYAVMSLINLTANLLTPEYPTLFLVHSDHMDTMKQIKQLSGENIFAGTIGTVVPKNSDAGVYSAVQIRTPVRLHASERQMIETQVPDGYVEASEGPLEMEISMFGRHETIPTFQKQQKIRNIIAIAIGILALITPYILIAIFSGFHTGSLSTPLQRGFVMLWLVGGQVFGASIGLIGHKRGTTYSLNEFRKTPTSVLVFSRLLQLAYYFPAVGGFVVVGLMMKQFGSCVLVWSFWVDI